MVFGWFKSKQRDQRRKIRLDRQHLETRARRFLKNYLDADAIHKPHFYRAVEDASQHCQPPEPGVSEFYDAQTAEAASAAAMDTVLAREAAVQEKDDRIAGFVTDAYATVGVAYHRAAGVYTIDEEMQELGTAAVHLLTMATSYIRANK